MGKNYLKVALRNIMRLKEYSLINILGLSIGMASFILIFLFVRYEMSYDRYHDKAERIYRVAQENAVTGNRSAITPNPMAPELAREIPEISYAVRINDIHSKFLVSYQNRFFKEEHFILADPEVFQVFSFPLVKGDLDTVLKDKFSVVISEEMAEKYFGREEPVGKVLHVDNQFDFIVTGVMKNVPRNSHFHCDFLTSFACADDLYWKGFSEDRTQSSLHTYILLQKGVSVSELEHKLKTFAERFMQPVIQEYAPMADQIPGGLESLKFKLFLQPLTRIHLHSHLFAELSANYDIRYIYIFSAVALFILVISCVNFTNLTTACSTRRTKEIGIRKVLGARRSQLIKQFITESLVMALTALLLAAVMVAILRPIIHPLMGEDLIGRASRSGSIWLALILLAFIVGIASGSYPAFFVSASQPVSSLRGSLLFRSKTFFRSFLVVVQFVITIGLIFSTLVVSRQLHYLKNKKLGFQKEHVIVLPFEDQFELSRFPLVKNELLKNPQILSVAGASNIVSRVYSSSPFWWEGAQEGDSMRVEKLFVDDDFIDTFGIRIVHGRNFSEEIKTDQENSFIINETAAKAFGWESPLGKKLAWARKREEKGTVIGVVEDFHFRSLHQKIEPLILVLGGEFFDNMYIKVHHKSVPAALSFIQKTCRHFFPERPLEYFFLDDDIDKMYKSETMMGRLFWYVSSLAIFIACLGLFGLISYSTEQRTKEIGIRKVLGSSVFGVVTLLSKDFVRLLVVANLIAWPLAYYVMHKWLQNFAYRIDVSILVFVLSTAGTLIVALFTLSFRSVRAARANPADTLRYE
jgi:putative ABC transport system permease protein